MIGAGIRGAACVLIAVALVGAAAALAQAPGTTENPAHYKVEVSIRYGADSFLRGKVTSSKRRCTKQATVIVRSADGTIVGKDTPDSKGRWQIFAPGITGLVQAKVASTRTFLESGVGYFCSKAKSPKIAPVDV